MAYEIIRPSGAGSETSIGAQYPDSTSHYDKVDEVVADGATTSVFNTTTSYQRDLYAMAAPVATVGVIDAVIIYFTIVAASGLFTAVYAKPSQKSGATVTDGTQVTGGHVSWATFSQTYTTNPATGIAYTWSDIDGLEVGVSLKSSDNAVGAYCTQVYIRVNYHIVVVTSALTRVTGLFHYYSRPERVFRLSGNLGGIAPLMMSYSVSKNPPNPNVEVPPIIVPPTLPPPAAPIGTTPGVGGIIPPNVPLGEVPGIGGLLPDVPMYVPPVVSPGSGDPTNGGRGGLQPELPEIPPYVPPIVTPSSGDPLNGGRGGLQPDLPDIPYVPPIVTPGSGDPLNGGRGGEQPDLPEIPPYYPPAIIISPGSGDPLNGGRGGEQPDLPDIPYVPPIVTPSSGDPLNGGRGGWLW